MGIFTQVRILAIRLFFFLLLSCFLFPLGAENRSEQVVSPDAILHEIDSLNKLVPSLNSIEQRLQYEQYKSQADSLWGDVSKMSLEDKINNYRALMCTLIVLDPSQPVASYYPYMKHLKSLSAVIPDNLMTLRFRANLIMSHIYLLTLKQYRAYPLLEQVVQGVKNKAQVESINQLPKDNSHLSMLYGVLLHQLLCYQVVKDSIVERNRLFLDSPLGEYSKALDKNCSTSGKTKAIAYGMVSGDYRKVIDLCDTLVSNKRLSRNDILYLLKIQIDAVNRLPDSPAMTRVLLRAATVQDSVLAHKEAAHNIDYNTYNQLNQEQKRLIDLRQEKEKVWMQHMILACVIIVLAGCVVLYLLLSYRKRSRMNLAFLKEVQASTETRKKALNQAEEACEQQLNLMRNFNHDLRVPMNALVGFSNLLGSQDDISEEEQQEAGEIVHQTSRQLLDMVNNILDIARLSTNHMIVENQDIPVAQLFDANMWRAFSEEIQPTHTLAISPYQEDTTVYSDSKHIVRIIELLIKNAMVTSDYGEIALSALANPQYENLVVDVVSPSSQQNQTVILNCLDRTYQIADYVDTDEYYLVLARMLCDLLNCDLMLKDSAEAGVHMQLVISLNPADHEK